MNIFFDVDDTIVTWDLRLRPGVDEVFRRLRDDGHVLYLWSGNGPRWEIVRKFDLAEHVEDCFWKPLYNHRIRLHELGVTPVPEYVIDDHLQVVEAFVGTVIKAPAIGLESDVELWRVYSEIRAFVEDSRDAAAPSLASQSQNAERLA